MMFTKLCMFPALPVANTCCHCCKLIPSSSTQYFLLLATPATFTLKCICSKRYACCFRICPNNLEPTLPTPATKRLISFISFSKNTSWMVLVAFFTSALDITAVIFLSDEPWAIALMLTPFLPSALKNLPLMPV